MSQIKFKEEIEKLIENRHKIPDEFWVRAKDNRAIWFMDRQKPSVTESYSFDEERFGLTKDGKIIWGFDSGCSCPSAWEESRVDYNVTEWKEFEVSSHEAFDADWQDESYANLQDYLLLIKEEVLPAEVLRAKNAEIRRYLIKRIGYEKIKNAVKAEVIHKDGENELLKFNTGEMYVKVKDSSTDREYLLFVEGRHETCRSAIAWTFGLQEYQYNPIIET